MKITIATPVLNGAKFLPEAIASMRRQTHENFEHIIVDGGSSDGSLEIAHKASAQDSRIRLIEAPGLGQYASITRAFDEAKGETLAWLNADDIYTPWALACVARAFGLNPEMKWLGGCSGCWDENGLLRYVRADAWRPRALIERGWFHKDLLGFLQQETIYFRRELFSALAPEDRAAFEEARLAGDFILWKRFARLAELEFIPTVLGGFRRHAGNRSTAGIDDYMAEARTDGAMFLFWPFIGLARRYSWFRSAARARSAADTEDRRIQ
ncbi:MAG: glycosyltransferase [Parvularculaceae bacterium]